MFYKHVEYTMWAGDKLRTQHSMTNKCSHDTSFAIVITHARTAAFVGIKLMGYGEKTKIPILDYTNERATLIASDVAITQVLLTYCGKLAFLPSA